MSTRGDLVHVLETVGTEKKKGRPPRTKNHNQEKNIPDITMEDVEVERLKTNYSARAPTDYVVSGPLRPPGCTNGNKGTGRVFETAIAAEEWARERFGTRFRWRIEESERFGRWAMLIAAPLGTEK